MHEGVQRTRKVCYTDTGHFTEVAKPNEARFAEGESNILFNVDVGLRQ